MTYDVKSEMPAAYCMNYKQSKTKNSGIETELTPTRCASRWKTELVRSRAVAQHSSAAGEKTELCGGNREV